MYCGAGTETRDHVPSRAFLDRPYPGNLPVVPACEDCNAGFSLDEEYLASLIDCVIAGTADPNFVPRSKVKQILERQPLLRRRLAIAGSQAASSFRVEGSRVENIVLKLARGHAAFELNEPQIDDPTEISSMPLATLQDDALRLFETPPTTDIWPEVGSRAMLRIVYDGTPSATRWIVVQHGRYRYLAAVLPDVVLVRMVISDYLACEVIWRN